MTTIGSLRTAGRCSTPNTCNATVQAGCAIDRHAARRPGRPQRRRGRHGQRHALHRQLRQHRSRPSTCAAATPLTSPAAQPTTSRGPSPRSRIPASGDTICTSRSIRRSTASTCATRRTTRWSSSTPNVCNGGHLAACATLEPPTIHTGAEPRRGHARPHHADAVHRRRGRQRRLGDRRGALQRAEHLRLPSPPARRGARLRPVGWRTTPPSRPRTPPPHPVGSHWSIPEPATRELRWMRRGAADGGGGRHAGRDRGLRPHAHDLRGRLWKRRDRCDRCARRPRLRRRPPGAAALFCTR